MKTKLKRITAVVLLIIISFTLSNAAGAYYNVDRRRNGIVQCMVECGMLLGTGSGLELDRGPTRIEIVVMLIRAIGKDADAKNMAAEPCVFTDVPSWAVGYANYAYANGISIGIGDGKFGTSNPATPNEYITMLLRKLGYDDSKGDFSWKSSTSFANANNFFQGNSRWALLSLSRNNNDVSFTRYDVASGAYYFLGVKYKDSETTLAENLIVEGVLTPEFVIKYGITDLNGNKFSLSAANADILNFELDGNKLLLTGSITSPAKEWLWIIIKKESTGLEVTNEAFSVSTDGKEINRTIYLPSGDETYNVRLYCNTTKYGNYRAWSYDDIRISSVKGTMRFQKSQVYLRNLLYQSSGMGEPSQFLAPEENIEVDAPEIIETATQITMGLETDYEKALAIHKYVADTISYDFDYYNNHNIPTAYSALDVLKTKRAVCLGYTNLMTALLRSIGIPCAYVTGLSPRYGGELTVSGDDENHIWCEVYIDGRWVTADCTWDSANSYINGKFKYDKMPFISYFDPSPELFASGHRISTVQMQLNRDILN